MKFKCSNFETFEIQSFRFDSKFEIKNSKFNSETSWFFDIPSSLLLQSKVKFQKAEETALSRVFCRDTGRREQKQPRE